MTAYVKDHVACEIFPKKRIREPLNLLTDAYSSIDTKTDRNGQKAPFFSFNNFFFVGASKYFFLRGGQVAKRKKKIKVSTKSVHKKCPQKVSTKRVHQKCQKSVNKKCQKTGKGSRR